MDGDGERRIERIVALLELGRYDDAETAARLELVSDPESSQPHQLLAWALIGQEDVTAALDHARAAAALEPDSAVAMQLLAATLAQVGEGVQAREAALRAVQLAPDDYMSHLAHAHALLFGIGGQQALGEAEMTARRAVELGPHEPETHVALGTVRWRLDDFAAAEAAFRRALALDPGDADAQLNLASLQISQNDLDTAASTLSRGLASNPQDRGLHEAVDTARTSLLVYTSASFAVITLVVGGLMLVLDFTAQRPVVGTSAIFAAVAHVHNVLRGLPAGGWSRLLPWRAPRGQQLGRWLACGLVAPAVPVWWLAPPAAGQAWLALVVSSGVGGAVLLSMIVSARRRASGTV